MKKFIAIFFLIIFIFTLAACNSGAYRTLTVSKTDFEDGAEIISTVLVFKWASEEKLKSLSHTDTYKDNATAQTAYDSMLSYNEANPESALENLKLNGNVITYDRLLTGEQTSKTYAQVRGEFETDEGWIIK